MAVDPPPTACKELCQVKVLFPSSFACVVLCLNHFNQVHGSRDLHLLHFQLRNSNLALLDLAGVLLNLSIHGDEFLCLLLATDSKHVQKSKVGVLVFRGEGRLARYRGVGGSRGRDVLNGRHA